MKTTEKFECFYGTENYWQYNSNYAYTDGIQWLKEQIGEENFVNLMQNIIKCTSFKNPFTSTKLNVENNTGFVKITDGNYKKLSQFELPKAIIKLDSGIYKIFCYNYVIMAASEY